MFKWNEKNHRQPKPTVIFFHVETMSPDSFFTI